MTRKEEKNKKKRWEMRKKVCTREIGREIGAFIDKLRWPHP